MNELESANQEIGRLKAEIERLKNPATKRIFIPTPEYLCCMEELSKGTPVVFLTGKAGTGKSTCVQQIRRNCGKRNIVIAYTGIAALTVSGQTINSFFGFPWKPLTKNEIRNCTNLDRLDLLNKLELIIIDEISMVRCDMLDAIDLYLRKNRQNGNSLPFGGVQILLVGDPFQLPPIASIQNGEQQALLEYGYNDFFFFNSFLWPEIKPSVIELQRIFRQNENNSLEFIEALNLIRRGQDVEKAVATINAYCAVRPHQPKNRPALTCHKTRAQTINETALGKLTCKRYSSKAIYTGTFTRPKKETDCKNGSTQIPAPDPLQIKEKARIMMLINDSRGRWVNGSTGTVEYIDSDNDIVSVRLDDTKQVVEIGRHIWKKTEFCYNKEKDDIEEITVGTFTQYPMMLAWAFTIHKAQGQTLNKMHIDLGTGAFAEGQAYVAFSRCTNMMNITMERKLHPADIKVSPEVRRFMIEFNLSH